MKYRLKQRYRVEDRVQRKHDLLLGNIHRLGQLHDVRLALVLAYKRFLGLHGLVRRIAQAAGYAQRAVVPQIAPDFPNDHRHEHTKSKNSYPASAAHGCAPSIA